MITGLQAAYSQSATVTAGQCGADVTVV